MITLAALLLQASSPPASPSVYSHLLPAPISEQVTIGRCGRETTEVRIFRRAGIPDRAERQEVVISTKGALLSATDQARLNQAVDAFGVITSVGIFCLDGRAAQLSFYGPVSGSDRGKMMTVNIDGSRLHDIR